MPAYDTFFHTNRPTFSYLTADQKDRIHEASLEILADTGAVFRSEEALALLDGAGARVDHAAQRAFIPPHVVEAALRACPCQIVLANRQGERIMPLMTRNSYYGPGSETPCVLDARTGRRRPAVKSDVVDAARMVDALPNLDFLMSFALATDITRRCEDVHHFEAMALNCRKPILFTSYDIHGLRAIHDICCAICGSEEAFRANPFVLHYVEPISPLVNPVESLEKLLFSAEKGIPVMYVPAPSCTGTAPATLAGAMALSNAENLMGLVLAQLKRPGAPFIYGGGPGILDPRTMVFSYGAPEILMSRIMRAEMGQYYRLPSFSTGGCSDAKLLDQQAAFEMGLSLMLSTLAGATFIHDIGYLEFGTTASLAALASANEFIGIIKRIVRGLEVSPEHLAVDVIREQGPGGNFLGTEHTVKHFRDQLHMSAIMDRGTFDAWEAAGRPQMVDRINTEVMRILDTHTAPELPADVVATVREITARADRQRR